jgi:hypothetical protein
MADLVELAPVTVKILLYLELALAFLVLVAELDLMVLAALPLLAMVVPVAVGARMGGIQLAVREHLAKEMLVEMVQVALV